MNLLPVAFLLVAVLLAGTWLLPAVRRARDTDRLTGLPNRRGLEEEARKWRSAGRETMASIVLCDVDRFRETDDAHGHGVGDAVPKGLAGLFARTIRADDLLGRSEEGEFVFVLRDMPVEQGFRFAERLRREVAAGSVHPALSERAAYGFGIAGWRPDEPFHEAVERAGEVLREARDGQPARKPADRNRGSSIYIQVRNGKPAGEDGLGESITSGALIGGAS